MGIDAGCNAAAAMTTPDPGARGPGQRPLNVLIASPLEPEYAAAIEAADSRLRVLYAPELLPVPRYPCDHGGVKRDLSPAELGRWSRLRAEADVSLDFDWQDPSAMAENCPRLEWVQGTSAGIGGFLERTGLIGTRLTFTTAAGVHGVPLAEFTLLGLLYFAKRMPMLLRWQADHHWERFTSGQLAGTTAVLVGLGGVGREIARTLDAVGVRVIGCGRSDRSYAVQGVTRYAGPDELDSVLAEADALILACPLTPSTQGMIGARQLSLLREGAVLVNVSRGAVVDEAAMTQALESGHLGGAALDVFAAEPLPPSSPLWDMGNVIISPHSASTAARENELLTDLFIDNLRRWLDRRTLRNLFDREAGY
jgi:glyoxylate/hydroxypyruvate reductase